MNARILLALFVSLAVMLSTVASAAGKVTLDPNQSPSFAASSQAKSDPRLAQNVTYEAVHKPVKTILSDLARISSVTIIAGSGQQDWQVRDRKMNLFVNDLPLARLMESIARVMKFRWKVSSQEPKTYRLISDGRLISRLLAEQNRKQEEFAQAVHARRQEMLDVAADLSKLGNVEGEALRQQNPYYYLLWKTGAAKATTALFKELPDVKATWLDAGMNITLPLSSVSPATRESLIEAMKGEWPYRQFYMGDGGKPLPADMQLGEATISLKNVPTPFTDWSRQAASSFGEIAVITPAGFFHVCGLTAADSIGQQLNAEYYLRGVQEGGTRDEVRGRFESESGYAKRREEADRQDSEVNDPYEMLEEAIKHPEDPELRVEVSLKVADDSSPDDPGSAEWKKFAAIQKAIAAASGHNIVSDSFGRMSVEAAALAKGSSLAYLGGPRVRGASVGSGRAQLREILDSFAKGYCYNWQRTGDVLEFRSRNWFKKRSAQIPDEWLERWRELLRKNGTLSLPEFAQIATLTFDQLSENVQQDSVLGCCVASAYPDWNVIMNQAILRLYLRLGQDQRGLLFTKDGLPVSTLNPDQWQLFSDACLYPYNGGWGTWQGLLKNHGEGLVLTGESRDDRGKIGYLLVIRRAGGDPQGWYIRMPKYTPPKKRVSAGSE